MSNRLFHIQDNDRPAWVVAPDFQDALNKWRRVVGAENDGEYYDPQGVELVCDANELIVHEDFEECVG